MTRKFREPTEEEKAKYDLESYIERKVSLMCMYETEHEVLRKDHEDWDEVAEKMEQEDEYEGQLPIEPELAKKYLEECERVIGEPATTTTERIVKANAAMRLSFQMNDMQFPSHITYFVVRECDTRLKQLMPNLDPDLTEDERAYEERLEEKNRKLEANIPAAALNLNPDAKVLVDESLAETLLDDYDQLLKATFVMRDYEDNGELLEDASKFRVTAWGRSAGDPSPFWEIAYEDDYYQEFPTRVDRKEMKDLLLMCDMYKD